MMYTSFALRLRLCSNVCPSFSAQFTTHTSSRRTAKGPSLTGDEPHIFNDNVLAERHGRSVKTSDAPLLVMDGTVATCVPRAENNRCFRKIYFGPSRCILIISISSI